MKLPLDVTEMRISEVELKQIICLECRLVRNVTNVGTYYHVE